VRATICSSFFGGGISGKRSLINIGKAICCPLFLPRLDAGGEKTSSWVLTAIVGLVMLTVSGYCFPNLCSLTSIC